MKFRTLVKLSPTIRISLALVLLTNAGAFEDIFLRKAPPNCPKLQPQACQTSPFVYTFR